MHVTDNMLSANKRNRRYDISIIPLGLWMAPICMQFIKRRHNNDSCPSAEDPDVSVNKEDPGGGGGLLMGKVITAPHRMGLAAAYRGHGEDKHVAVGVMAPTPGPLGSLEVLQLF